MNASSSHVDWSILNQKTKNLTTMTSVKDREGVIHERVYSGLEVRLSAVTVGAPAGGFPMLNIYADTLVMDGDSFSAKGGIVVARTLDLTPLGPGGHVISLPRPHGSGVTVFQFLVNEVKGGPFRVSAGGAPYTVPVGPDPLQSVIVLVMADGTLVHDLRPQPIAMADLLGRAWPLSSFKASFTAAAWLSSSNKVPDRALAAAMLSWVVSALGSMGASHITGAFLELYNQAASLLVPLNTAESALYVPVLSSELYKSQINVLLGAMDSYEQKIHHLQTAEDIKKAIADVSSTLASVASHEAAPIRTDLELVTTNIASLYAEIQELQNQFSLQHVSCEARFSIMVAAIKLQQIDDLVKAGFEMALNVMSVGVSVAKLALGDPKAAGEAIGNLTDIIKTTYTLMGQVIQAADAVTGAGPEGTALLGQAKELMLMQEKLLASFQTSVVLWVAAQSGAGTTDLPAGLGAAGVDADLAWNNYVVAARAQIAVIKQGATSSLEAIENYQASLEILANYGKAIGAKLAIYANQVARAVVLTSELRAVQNIQAEWEALKAKAKSDEERLAALVGLLQTRSDDIRRSVFVSWTYYYNSYYYLYFVTPPVVIDLDMSVAQLRDALGQVSLWIDRLLGVPGSGSTIVLPNEGVELTFHFPIRTAASTAVETEDTALVIPAKGGAPASILWNIPMGTHQLDHVLPDGGNVAIWVTKAEFFVDGVKPNPKDNVVVSVSTSGSYTNGFGPTRAHRFVTNGLESSYAYKASTQTPYIPWQVNTAVYMAPTAYTQWAMVFDPGGGDPSKATRLTVKTTVAFRRRPA